ncbi:MAG TPA: type I-C CRISPR-associated protein Cas5c, partial [Anaerolineaceae bacterium]|nr:type I-C CRISPR-associated protein Cas5c [Anaerolineaceae bacterium]
PSPSAVRGIIEAVYWKPAIRWVIDRIHVLNPILFTNIRRNEVSDKVPFNTAKSLMQGNTNKDFYLDILTARQQRASMILKDVDYVFEVHFEMVPEEAGPTDTVEKHYNIALRRLRKGQHYTQPVLGTREFPAKVSLIENRDEIPKSVLEGEQDLGWMLYDMDYSDPENILPIFFKAKMIDGIIDLQNVLKAS